MDSVRLMATLVGDLLCVMQGAGEIWYIYVDFFCVISSLGILLLHIVVCLLIFHLFLSNGISLYLRMKIYKNTMLFEDFYCAIFYFYQYDSKFYVFETQVTAAGDLCAICQEKMHSPILATL
jgi:hypothetical protein